MFDKKKKVEDKKINEPTKSFDERKKDMESEADKMREEHKTYIKDKNDIIQNAIEKGEDVEDLINKNQPEQRVDANKPISENLIEKKSFWLNLMQKSVFLLCIGIIMAMIVWAFYTTKNTQVQDVKNLVVWLVVMGMLIFVMILINLGTGTGIEIWKRFVYKFKYKKGIYVNGIILMKSGVIKRFFIKKEDTGEIRINKSPYVPNPKLLFNLDGVPSYMYREGNPDPLNPWETKLSNKFSCAEMDNVMYSASTFDFKAWLQKNLLIFLIGVGLTVICAVGAAAAGFMVYNMLKKGQYNVEPVANVCKEIFNIAINQTAQVVNNGGTIPTPIPIGG